MTVDEIINFIGYGPLQVMTSSDLLYIIVIYSYYSVYYSLVHRPSCYTQLFTRYLFYWNKKFMCK